MFTMTTTQELGQTPGRARCLVAARTAQVTRATSGSWRLQTSALAQHATATTSGVAVDVTNAYLGNPTDGGKGFMSIKRPARHLTKRST